MKYKLDEKIIEKGTYVISKSAVWCWDEENSSWISRCVAVLDIDKFNEKIKLETPYGSPSDEYRVYENDLFNK